MKGLRSSFKIILAIIVIIILGVWVYVQSHQPQLRGKLSIDGLGSDVKVYFDPHGVPHIYATNASDAYMALGYVHAQDRLFQMELMKRVGQGRLAEIFGSELVGTDAFFRTIGIHRKASEDAKRFNELSERTKEITNSYLNGVNYYIREGKLPLEFKILGIEAEEYNVEDMYNIAGYMAYSFAYALRTDPIVEYVARNLGSEYLRDLDLGIHADSIRFDENSWIYLDSLNPSQNEDILSFLENFPCPGLQGSNNWVLGPSRTLSSKVILANDTHIKYGSPSVWYEAHIEYPGVGLYGNYLAGIPVPLIAHTRNHGWGITMFEDDDSDFFYEKLADQDTSHTVYRDSLRTEVKKFRELIRIKGESDTVFTVYETKHGPLINQFLPGNFSKPVSMYWNYTSTRNNLLEAFSKMSVSSNLDEFAEAVSMINSPGLNIGYGDASGNIAIWSAGKLIKRPKGKYGKMFLDGSNGKEEFQGFYPFSKNPTEINPVEGFLVSANQYHDTSAGITYPGYYAPDTRYERIVSRLRDIFPASVDSMKYLINDVKSEREAETAHIIASIIDSSGQVLNQKETAILNLLKEWNGQHRLRDQEPVVYYKMLYHILRKTFSDELGEEFFNTFLTTHLMKRTYTDLIRNSSSPWWDNVKSPEKETRTSILIDSFYETLDELSAQFGSEYTEWRWETAHSTTFEHPLGKSDYLAPFFNVGMFSSPGGFETINNAGFTLNGDGEYRASYGPAMRIIIDFADVENAVSILPTGNSGNVMSPYYKDQSQMYINGEFRKMMMNKKEIISTSSLLELVTSN